MNYLPDDFKQIVEDEKLLMQVDMQRTRGIYKIDVSNANMEVAEEVIKRLQERLKDIK